MRLISIVAAAALMVVAVRAQAAPPPAAAFGRLPAIAGAAISPDGRRIAILGGTAQRRFVSIATVDDSKLAVLQLGEAEALGLTWAGSDYILARLGYWQDKGLDHGYRFVRNVTITTEAKAIARLLDGDQFSALLVQQDVVATPPGNPQRVVVMGLNRDGGRASLALWDVDPLTGKGVIAEKGRTNTFAFDVDVAGKVRVRLDEQMDQKFSLSVRQGDQWTAFWKADLDQIDRYLGYSTPDDSIYLLEDGKIVKMRLGQEAKEVVSQPPADRSPSIIWDSETFGPVAIGTAKETWEYEWLLPELGAVHAALSKLFPGQTVLLKCWSDDKTRYLVRVSSHSSAPAWYLFDKARKELSPLGDEYPELKGAALGQGRWLKYKARDGLDLRGYLTLPPNAVGKPPVVVLVGRGPAGGGYYDFDYLAQFLASRGYAVLQPRHRGQWGDGKAFVDAGKGERGGKMQTDVIDGLAAAAATGEIDASRACIVGAEAYGGYAALAGVSLHPGTYACAASIGGISDLGMYVATMRGDGDYESVSLKRTREHMGAAEKGRVAETSPARLAARIDAPVLLIHGDRDLDVPIEQSEVMAKALKLERKPVEYIVLKGEGNELTQGDNRTQTLEAVERFLATNLPVKTPQLAVARP